MFGLNKRTEEQKAKLEEARQYFWNTVVVMLACGLYASTAWFPVVLTIVYYVMLIRYAGLILRIPERFSGLTNFVKEVWAC